ncbi:hypothetical protein K1T71_006080 [Dendrolimus kikuchii]|uniref:Uncharacterized protein n=1 Tax=Dendrolimus kikuchii TaxID=765133 RepID=A0ACC1D3Y6_9NEOP|nr:hypothetical protein K1T71_006080 [Dendrolimus kikuchii]
MRNMLLLKFIFFTIIYTVASLPEELDYQIEDYDSSAKEELYENESAEMMEDLPGNGTESISDVPSTVLPDLTTEDPNEAQTITTLSTTANSNDKRMNVDKSQALLEEVLNASLNTIISIINMDYDSIFKDLNDTLNNPHYNDEIMDALMPIQNDIAIEINKEKNLFIEIHENVPKINAELAVVVKTKDIMNKIQEAVEFLTSIPT